jgi:catechol 2,3-dioxygenase-like lactoylglutathione lyase family enzyme
MGRRKAQARVFLLLACSLPLLSSGFVLRASDALHVTAVDSIGMTVENMDRAVDFYTRVLTFEKISDREAAGREYELFAGVFGARARIVRLRLGEETIELTEYLAPKGRPVPADLQPNDRAFQHLAIIVSDMAAAYTRLRHFNVEHASTAPQTLPGWNPDAGGISAFYFRDPDRHFLEILNFPVDKGLARWHPASLHAGATTPPLFLGVDHTAIVVGDTDQSLRLYRDTFEMKVVGESENYDTEQEHLNNVFGARLRITTLRAAAGPGVELLEYLAPRDGRAAPDLRANDIAHWQTTVIAAAPSRVNDLLRQRIFSLVSPNVISLPNELAIRNGVLLRDPDGHGVVVGSR